MDDDRYRESIRVLDLEDAGIPCSLCKVRLAVGAVAVPDGGLTVEGCQVWTFVPLCKPCIDTAEPEVRKLN